MINDSKVNVYVFGAGASVHVGAPLTKDFLFEGFSLLPFPDAYDVSTQKFRMVAQLIDRLYGSRLETYVKDALSPDHIWRPSDIPSVNIEELLSFVDLGLRRGEAWLPFGDLQDALHEFVFTTLEQTTLGYYSDCYRRLENGTLGHNRNCYDKLVDYIMHVDEINCMITFNYDLFLDQAMSKNNHEVLGDYNIEFAEVENFERYKRLLSRQRRDDDVDLLKLHGSLNWARCPRCQRLFLAYFRRYRQILDRSCLSCGNGQVLPVLVPPTLLKQIDIPGLVSVWKRAEYFLEKADTLTIFGYSFPDADIEAKWLFKRSIAKNPGRPALTLVEPVSSVRKRVLDFLGHFFQQGPVFFDTFEEYCEKQIMS
jgi:hypothetical protein